MDLECRPITPAEVDAFARITSIAFGQEPFAPEMPWDFARLELDRTRAAFAGDELVGTGRNFSLELTVPGGAIVPAAGVSWISVLPSHRRRGVLRTVMAALRDDAVAHGEPVSILSASEGGIYGRFGYGVATWRMYLTVERAASAFSRPMNDDGRVRFLDRSEAIARFPAVYPRACALRPGMVSRPPEWWADPFFFVAPPAKACFFALHESADGTADGFLVYEVTGDFAEGINRKHLHVVDLVALTPAVRAHLWQFAFSVDLVHTVSAHNVAVDESLRFLLADVRQLRVDAVNDHLWVQIVDLAGALEARRYSSDDRVVLEVHDDATVTRVELEGGAAGAQCRPTTSTPDIVLGLSQLGSIYLGGVRAEQHAAAGTVEECTGGAVARLDAMFASYPVPASPTWF